MHVGVPLITWKGHQRPDNLATERTENLQTKILFKQLSAHDNKHVIEVTCAVFYPSAHMPTPLVVSTISNETAFLHTDKTNEK